MTVPSWTAEAVTDRIDLHLVLAMLQLLNPSCATETSVSATIRTISLLAWVSLSGGCVLLMVGIYRDFLWPVASIAPVLNGRVSDGVSLAAFGGACPHHAHGRAGNCGPGDCHTYRGYADGFHVAYGLAASHRRPLPAVKILLSLSSMKRSLCFLDACCSIVLD